MTFRELLLDTWHIDNTQLCMLQKQCTDNITWNLEMRRRWYAKPRNTSEQIEAFYKDNFLYSAHLLSKVPLDETVEPNKLHTDEWIYTELEDAIRNKKHLLDFGSAFGNTGCVGYCMGYWVDMVDIDAPHSRFVEMMTENVREKRLSFEYTSYEQLIRDGLWHMYDVINVSQVMEHLYRPLTVLRKLWEAMLPGGILLMDCFFDDYDDKAPYHLKRNNPFGDVEYWNRCVAAIGFKQIRNRVWYKPEDS